MKMITNRFAALATHFRCYQNAFGVKLLKSSPCRTNTSYASYFQSDGTTYEQPTPVVLVCGEGLNRESFLEYSRHLATRGYCGMIFEPDCNLKSLEAVAQTLDAAIRVSEMTPPILISHSFSSLICQGFPVLPNLIQINS